MLWIYFSYILNYEKTDRTGKYNDNYGELAIEKVRTEFDINISRSTIRKWDIAPVQTENHFDIKIIQK